MAKTAAKKNINRKPVSSRTKGLICLIVLCALTVFVSCLGFAGMKLDSEGVNILMPWVPFSSANWPASLPLNRALGGGSYNEYTLTMEDDTVKAEDIVKVVSDRFDGLGETDKTVALKGENTLRVELRAMDDSRLSGIRSLALTNGHFTFQNPSTGETVLTEKDIASAVLGMNSAQTSYVITVKTNEEGTKKLAETDASYLSVQMDGSSVASYAFFGEGEISISITNYNTAANVVYIMSTGPINATLSPSGSGKLAATAGGVKTVVLVVAAVLLAAALIYLVLRGKLTGVSGIWMVWCAVLLGLFFVAAVVVQTVYALDIGCLIAILVGILLAIYSAVTRTDAISAQIASGASPKSASRLGFNAAMKPVWLVHGCVLILSLILMIFNFSRPTGYVLSACVMGSAIVQVLMRAFQACFTTMTNKAALFGKTK